MVSFARRGDWLRSAAGVFLSSSTEMVLRAVSTVAENCSEIFEARCRATLRLDQLPRVSTTVAVACMLPEAWARALSPAQAEVATPMAKIRALRFTGHFSSSAGLEPQSARRLSEEMSRNQTCGGKPLLEFNLYVISKAGNRA